MVIFHGILSESLAFHSCKPISLTLIWLRKSSCFLVKIKLRLGLLLAAHESVLNLITSLLICFPRLFLFETKKATALSIGGIEPSSKPGIRLLTLNGLFGWI